MDKNIIREVCIIYKDLEGLMATSIFLQYLEELKKYKNVCGYDEIAVWGIQDIPDDEIEGYYITSDMMVYLNCDPKEYRNITYYHPNINILWFGNVGCKDDFPDIANLHIFINQNLTTTKIVYDYAYRQINDAGKHLSYNMPKFIDEFDTFLKSHYDLFKE